VASEQPGCGGCEAEECVCTLDPYCCEVAWDQWCVGSYAQYCEGDCGAFCGDAFCDADAGEDCVTCVKDCGPCPVECGDGVCDLLETCEDCPEDCGECAECGDGLCQPPETCNNCPDDCGECGFCGDDECVGVEDCNNCPEDCGECGGSCEAAWSLACGTSDEWGLTEEGTTDAVSSYSCNQFNYDGPEYTYEFKATCDGLATVSLGDETSATDVMVLEGGADCDPSQCIAYGFTTAIFDVVAGGNYFIVVDGYQGADGDYSIHLNCECGPECGNDMCEEGEDCVVCPEDCGECTGDCCAPHDSTGCDDADVEACVCDFDDFCCEVFWDMLCVAEAQEECGLVCEAECGNGICQSAGGEDCFSCPEDCGECPLDVCDIDEAVECGMVSAASNAGMDNDVEDYSCSGKIYDAGEYAYVFIAPCDGPVTVNLLNETGATDLLVLGGEDEECAPWACVDMGVSTVTLDAMAGELYYFVVDGAAGWEGDFDLQVECSCGVGDCCLPKGEPGCEQAGVEGCVCEFDPFCCDVAWDSICVDEAISECGLDCGGIEKCGDGLCAGDEDCLTCPEDCGDCCGNGLCQPELGEDCDWCPEDCGACAGEGSCCVANGSIGCDDPEVQDCVCAMDPYCCETEWDSICAAEADECGSCTGDCCEAGDTPGCDDEFIEACVCEQDPYCCNIAWDDLCAAEVEDLGCGDCGGVECGDGECNGDEDCTWCPEDCGDCCGNGMCEAEFGEDCVTCEADCGACPGEGSCCIANGSAGCADASVEACVCAMDPFCCDVTWDGICATEADECGSCTGDCCEAGDTPGCDDEGIEACVCDVDPFCCDVAWDGICASEVEDLGCGSCGGEECGDGDCTGSEDCHICPDDCGDCCGNGVCEPEYDEDCDTCMEDCGECMDECEPMWSIDCGETDEWTTELGEAVVDAYNCVGGDYAAKEYVYQFVAPCTTTALFTLTKGPDVEGFLDIIALDPAIGCHGEACIDYDWMSGDEAFLPLAVEEGQEYFIVVDGYSGASGDYTLTVECECVEPTCGDGNCGDDENCITCPEDCGACEGSCCVANGTPGCDDPDVQACVCEMDPFCCDVEWDGLCAEEADECGSCDGDCCEANGTPGCDDAAVEACVCADDPFCCNVNWDGLCVDEVEGLGCGTCGGEECGDDACTGTEDCENCPMDCGECCGNGECEGAFGEDCETCEVDCGACPGEGSCCIANGSPGCDNPEVQDCVCANDPFCCDVEWDGLCAAGADACGSCGGDCCAENGTPGCEDQDVEECLCELDPFCCEVTWDAICADEAEAHCDADCSVAAGDCCAANGTPGCDDADCQATVCDADPFCCDTAWDQLCADEAAEMCPLCAGEPWCGDGECNAEETCATCAEDCGDCAGDCCESNGTPGCDDIDIQDCVCELDPYCCEVNWDGICAGEAEADCGADCGGIDPICGDGECNGAETCEDCPQDCGFCAGEGSCCISNGTPGCDDLEVQECVCAADPFCCNTTWDGLCAAGADDCGSCGGDCCASNGTPGCDDEDIEACVCELDAYCCDVTWDGACATEAENDCGAICGEVKGDCCEANGTPGCEDAECEATVCAVDPYCCETQWDGICGDEALQMCAVCGAGPFCGDGDCGEAENCGNCSEDCGPCEGNCCLANGTPGCDDADVTACVCDMDPYCCESQWDSLCASEADECGSCNGDCCEANDTPGCDDEDCEAAVCEADPFCCNVTWDDLCAAAAADTCEICLVGPECGDGSCNGAETCEDCPEDCGFCAGEGSCCIANGSVGCDDPDVQACVCEMDPYCCQTAWDGLCASEADECGSCNGNCCEANGNAGCDDEGCEATVCEADAYCCDVNWDNICANEALEMCDICMVGPECGDGSCNGDETCQDCPEDCGWCEGEGGCCIANGTPGCDDPEVTACVCDMDPYCCETAWDQLCASEADECGTCNGDCCVGNDTPGCDDETCEASVCEADPYCCDTKWDGICAGAAEDMCEICIAGPVCGDGACTGDEGCEDCPEDCGWCPGEGGCCIANGTPGCDDPAVTECVCDMDPYCCESQWDSLCASEADECGTCNGDCCVGNDTPGCDDETCEASVCEADPYCCDTKWDGICAGAAEDMCEICIAGPVCGDGACTGDEGCEDCPEDCGWCPGEGGCCIANGTPGCDDPDVTQCVCDMDAYCCTNQWDSLCASQADECGTCNGDCCAGNDTPGCDDETCEAAVCEVDPYCCDTKWDDICAGEAEDMCEICIAGPVCGDGACTGDEGCEDCPEDCGWCPGEGGCCIANGTPGCDDPAVTACVCDMDAFCCTSQWDALCASQADECGTCDGDCCAANETPGCDDETCEATICAADPYCCDTKWDSICAGAAEDTCEACAVGPECGDGSCNGAETCADCPEDCGWCEGEGSCCIANGTPGCDNKAVQDCVCDADPFCCTNTWDSLCAAAADDCGSCGGDCCAANDTPGCDDETCEATVCAADPYCCDTKWDSICAGQALDMCAGCAVDPFCGDGNCDADEDCVGCAGDCGGCQGDCCASNGSIGCNDPMCQAAVCAADPWCCNVNWDNACAAGAADLCPACAPEPFCGDGNCDANENCVNCAGDCGGCQGDCCASNGSVGCNDPACQAAVCAGDSFCCEVEWDGLCAADAEDLCPACGGGACDDGYEPDCNGDCFPSAWIGDGVCDDDVNNESSGLGHFNCAAFGWDGGDCAQ